MRFVKFVQQRARISRRKSEALIKAGRVELNDEIVRNPFIEIDPEGVRALRVRGREIDPAAPEGAVYKFYKPRGMLSSHHDPHHKNTIGQVLRRYGLEGYAIAGRLDRDAQGLVVLSNDGELVNRLTHPRYEVAKTYRVRVPRALPERHAREIVRKMERGVEDREAGETLRIRRGRLVRAGEAFTEFELVLTEGKKREIKRLFKRFTLPVSRLVRIGLGPLTLGNLEPNELQRVDPGERRALGKLKT